MISNDLEFAEGFR